MSCQNVEALNSTPGVVHQTYCSLTANPYVWYMKPTRYSRNYYASTLNPSSVAYWNPQGNPRQFSTLESSTPGGFRQ